MQILNQRQIIRKTKRIAIEIIERNFGEKELILAGINNNGMRFAQMLLSELYDLATKMDMKITVTRIQLNPANPLQSEVRLDMSVESVKGKSIIIIDDVANTGRTVFYAIKPLLETLPKKIEVAVLVDRKHKSFPVRADYVGLSLATTLREDIEVHLEEAGNQSVYLR